MSPVLVLIIAIVYGLSTDYEVFLLSRMVEARAQGASTTESIRIGTAHTGRIITAAALILIVVTGAFAFSELVMMKYIAYGMIAALIIDATLIRMFLVPATMKLLGDDCWWAPHWMKRIQEKIGLGEPILDDELDGKRVMTAAKTARSAGTVVAEAPTSAMRSQPAPDPGRARWCRVGSRRRRCTSPVRSPRTSGHPPAERAPISTCPRSPCRRPGRTLPNRDRHHGSRCPLPPDAWAHHVRIRPAARPTVATRDSPTGPDPATSPGRSSERTARRRFRAPGPESPRAGLRSGGAAYPTARTPAEAAPTPAVGAWAQAGSAWAARTLRRPTEAVSSGPAAAARTAPIRMATARRRDIVKDRRTASAARAPSWPQPTGSNRPASGPGWTSSGVPSDRSAQRAGRTTGSVGPRSTRLGFTGGELSSPLRRRPNLGPAGTGGQP